MLSGEKNPELKYIILLRGVKDTSIPVDSQRLVLRGNLLKSDAETRQVFIRMLDDYLQMYCG